VRRRGEGGGGGGREDGAERGMVKRERQESRGRRCMGGDGGVLENQEFSSYSGRDLAA